MVYDIFSIISLQKTYMMTNRRDFLHLSAAAMLLASCESKSVEPLQISRFAVTSDGHLGQENTDSERFYQELITALNIEKATKGLDLVVINGDLVHGNHPELLPKAKSFFDQLKCPYYVTRGNHDRVSAAVWKQTWGYDLNHYVEYGSVALVLFDTSDATGNYLCGDTQWLEATLKLLQTKTQVFVFMHIPFKRTTNPNDDSNDCTQTEQILVKYSNVKAIFHGHVHDIDSGWSVAGKGLFFDGHFGSSWGTTYRGYRIVENGLSSIYSYQYDFTKSLKINENTFNI